MTNGQNLASKQLREIETASEGLLSIDYEKKPDKERASALFGISIKCGSYPHKAGGLKFRERESFEIIVGSNFPFQKPDVKTTHKRFAGFPHVQWKRCLCLYIAPDIEWTPSDGMYGFIDRLKLWLERAALNELDPEGAPLHPPVAYTRIGETSTIVVKKDTPKFNNEHWCGLAHLNKVNPKRFDLIGWQSSDKIIADSEYVGAVILTNKVMPYEFPEKISDLFLLLNENGITTDEILLQLQIAAFNNSKGEPLLFIIGTPMRGIVGEELNQHLTVWYIYPDAADAFRLTIEKYSKDEREKELGEKVEQILLDEWVDKCGVSWCRVLEARPEVINRRDLKSPMSAFQDLNLEVWGCGALGANVALSLARADVKSLKLIDNGIVTPGLLVRQPFFDSDIGRGKVNALKDQINAINPELKVEMEYSNIIHSILEENRINSTADVIIDCTASNSVRYKMEQSRKNMTGPLPIIFSMMLDSEAKNAVLAEIPADFNGGATDIYRKSKLAIKKDFRYKSLEEAFYSGKTDENLFQPEPGCSSPTFIASSADVKVISNSLLNIAANNLKRPDTKTGKSYFIKQPYFALNNDESLNTITKFTFEEDFIQIDPFNEYQVRYSQGALRDLRGYMNKNEREGREESETGGIMWGEIDDTLKIIWVSKITGPPADSKASPDQFICGTEGIVELNEKLKKSSGGSLSYIGIWHTHPKSKATPSQKDYEAVHNLLNEGELSTKKVFISIIGSLDVETSIGSYVFEKDNFYEMVINYE
ncbi:MAG TPA: hypothetical protein DD671_03105 [Balneolaceae bacterium]|nr:hypothetical protein [Balneolaceae bacterium]